MPPRNERYFVVREFMTRGLGLTGLPLMVYARIYGFCENGGQCFESKKSMAELMDVDERSVFRAIKSLKGLGLIVETGTHSTPSGHETKAYGICLDAVERGRDAIGTPGKTPPPDISSGDQMSGLSARNPDEMPCQDMTECHPIPKRMNKFYGSEG